MARTLKDAKLDTPSARKKLKRRKEPHWRSISPGLAVGYRKLVDGGTWIVRHYTPADGRRYKALGTADDVVDDGQGKHVLTFAQAQARARDWFEELTTGTKSGHLITVREAGKNYVDYLRAKRKTADDTELRLKKWVYPPWAIDGSRSSPRMISRNGRVVSFANAMRIPTLSAAARISPIACLPC